MSNYFAPCSIESTLLLFLLYRSYLAKCKNLSHLIRFPQNLACGHKFGKFQIHNQLDMKTSQSFVFGRFFTLKFGRDNFVHQGS